MFTQIHLNQIYVKFSECIQPKERQRRSHASKLTLPKARTDNPPPLILPSGFDDVKRPSSEYGGDGIETLLCLDILSKILQCIREIPET